jgi:hypothetical protein
LADGRSEQLGQTGNWRDNKSVVYCLLLILFAVMPFAVMSTHADPRDPGRPSADLRDPDHSLRNARPVVVPKT